MILTMEIMLILAIIMQIKIKIKKNPIIVTRVVKLEFYLLSIHSILISLFIFFNLIKNICIFY